MENERFHAVPFQSEQRQWSDCSEKAVALPSSRRHSQRRRVDRIKIIRKGHSFLISRFCNALFFLQIQRQIVMDIFRAAGGWFFLLPGNSESKLYIKTGSLKGVGRYSNFITAGIFYNFFNPFSTFILVIGLRVFFLPLPTAK